MATTIVASPLTVTVTENITLSGKKVGAVNSNVISGIKSIDKSIVTATTDKLEYAAFGTGVDSGRRIYNEANVRYIRITNKDDANFVVLFFTNESSDEVAIKLDFGQSFIWNGDLSGGVVDTMDANSGGAASTGQLADITKIQMQADTASVDVEIFIASV